MATLAAALASNLVKYRKEKGFTQAHLAKAVGLSRQTIANYESGEGGVTGDAIRKLAAALGVEETDLTADPTLILGYKILREFTAQGWDRGIIKGVIGDPNYEALLRSTAKVALEELRSRDKEPEPPPAVSAEILEALPHLDEDTLNAMLAVVPPELLDRIRKKPQGGSEK